MFLLCKLNQCCCGCSLRTGTLILGILDLIFAIIVLITSSTTAVAAQTMETSDPDVQETLNVIRAVYITLAVFSALLVLIDTLLLVGVTQNKAGLLLPYLIFTVISIIANVISSIIFASAYFNAGATGSGVSGLIYAFLFLGIKWYFLSVVHSHYTELKSGTNNNANVLPHAQTYPNAQQAR